MDRYVHLSVVEQSDFFLLLFIGFRSPSPFFSSANFFSSTCFLLRFEIHPQAQLLTVNFPVTMQTSTVPLLFLTKGVTYAIILAAGAATSSSSSTSSASSPTNDSDVVILEKSSNLNGRATVIYLVVDLILVMVYFALAPFMGRSFEHENNEDNKTATTETSRGNCRSGY